MNGSGETHPDVSCKAALIREGPTPAVLAMWYEGPQRFGLPGGHIKDNETPPVCMVREVREETGLVLPADVFTKHENFVTKAGKLILPFSAVVVNPETVEIGLTRTDSDQGYKETPWWLDEEAIKEGALAKPYATFALDALRQHLIAYRNTPMLI